MVKRVAVIVVLALLSMLSDRPVLRAQDSSGSIQKPVAQDGSLQTSPSPALLGQTSSGQTSLAQSSPTQNMMGMTLVVIPFENISSTPGLEWLGESFPEAFHEQLNSPVLYVSSRSDRLRAYDRQGIPAGVHPSRATLYRLAEQMDVDYVVLGSYSYDGAHLTATVQLLNMRAPKLTPPVTESGPLADLGALQSALAWDLIHQIRSDYSVPKDKYVANAASLRLDAQEDYVRGMLATSIEEKVQHYRDAVRLNPDYRQAWLELGKTYYTEHSYEPAMAALGQVLRSSSIPGSISGTTSGTMSGALAREANFYFGLSAYAHGDFAKAESAFEFVAARLPLAEVYNNLGVVVARRSQRKASEYFARAIQNDPSDPDYHFNMGVALAETGDHPGATRELRATLDHRPNDAEARTLLESQTAVASGIVPASSTAKIPIERIKRNYEEDAFRQMTTQMGSWAEQRFMRSDPKAHARFHVELGKELMDHGFSSEAEEEFEHAATVDPSSTAPLTALAEDYEASGDASKARAEAEASLRIRESAEAYLVLARLDLKENRTEAASQDINRVLQMEPGNQSGLEMKRTLAAKLAEKAQPLSQP